MEHSQTRSFRRKPTTTSLFWTVLTHVIFGGVCFQLGFVLGGGEKVWEYITETPTVQRHLKNEDAPTVTSNNVSGGLQNLPDTVRGLFTSRITLPRDEFIKEFDIGVPWDETERGSSEVLLFYSSEWSQPDNPKPKSIQEATKNCDILKVVLTQKKQKDQCFAIVPQWDSYHVHKFMRLKSDSDKSTKKVFDSTLPLRYVSRRHEKKAGKQVQFPNKIQSKRYLAMLQEYLRTMEDTMERLKPIATQVAGASKVVVVLVVNFGQSELLFNFVCNARSRGLDLSKILVFATDKDAADLAKSLEIAVFEVGDAFGEMPTKAASAYGDKVFQHMMFSKVYCVHMINAMGFDVLFQDVDVIWYKDPLPFFQLPEAGDFDFYFQDGEYWINSNNSSISQSNSFKYRQTVRILLDMHHTHRIVASTTFATTSEHNTFSRSSLAKGISS